MRIAALMIVRDEEVFLEWNIRYHLDAGFDHLFIINHCSVDQTMNILRKFVTDSRVIVVEEADPTFDHGKLANNLLQLAIQHYEIDWFFLIDADEFLGISSGVHEFIDNLERQGIIYATIGWANAVAPQVEGANPIDVSTFYYCFPEREWQHEGHFRKAIAKNHEGIEVVVGGHYFKAENNPEFLKITKGAPVKLSASEAKYFHFENRNNASNLFKKWERLALNERDSSSSDDAPWLERIQLIRSYVASYKGKINEVDQRWFKEARTLWGTLIPEEKIFNDPSLSNWGKTKKS